MVGSAAAEGYITTGKIDMGNAAIAIAPEAAVDIASTAYIVLAPVAHAVRLADEEIDRERDQHGVVKPVD